MQGACQCMKYGTDSSNVSFFSNTSFMSTQSNEIAAMVREDWCGTVEGCDNECERAILSAQELIVVPVMKLKR